MVGAHQFLDILLGMVTMALALPHLGTTKTYPNHFGDPLAHDMLTDSWPCLKVHLLDMCASTSIQGQPAETLGTTGHPILSIGDPLIQGSTPPKKWHKSAQTTLGKLYVDISSPYGYGSIPIHTIFRGMNIHLPAILMFTRGIGFWPIPI